MAQRNDFIVKRSISAISTATISGTSQSTSTVTGALIVAGGVGIGGDVYVGGSIVAQQLIYEYTTVTTTSTVTGDVIETTNGTESTSTTTGAVIVSGGAGFGKNIYSGGYISAVSGFYIGSTQLINEVGVWVGSKDGLSGDSGQRGFSGYSGISGFSGARGLIGATGASGISGFSGYSGISGTSGVSGFSGYSGISGTNGVSGFSGYSGISGTSGYSGVNVAINNDTISNITVYPMMSSETTGNLNTATISTTKIYFNPSTGILSVTDLNSLSDLAFKTNVEPVSRSLEILQELNPVKFTWVDNKKTSYGVIAQELETILPELVHTTNGIKSVSYQPLIAFLISAVQQLQRQINELRSNK